MEYIHNIKNRKVKVALLLLGIYFFIGVFGSFIANNASDTYVLNPLIPYSYQSIDLENIRVSPFANQNIPSLYYRHWLGTDELGRDTLAGMIHGAEVSMKVGIMSLILAMVIAVLMSFLSGILGDHRVKISKIEIGISVLFLIISIFYFIYAHLIITIGILLFFGLILWGLRFLIPENFRVHSIPFDWIINRFMEIFKSIPGLFLLLFLLTIFKKQSYTNIIVIIGLTSWPGLTRYMRAELIKIREEKFYLAAQGMGLSPLMIYIKHCLKNIMGPVIVALSFGFASTILLEATLSFLGLGIPIEEVSWGSMLNTSRQNINLWWLAVFPGLAIFIIVVCFNILGDYFQQQR